jgi:hypothetical protein
MIRIAIGAVILTRKRPRIGAPTSVMAPTVRAATISLPLFGLTNGHPSQKRARSTITEAARHRYTVVFGGDGLKTGGGGGGTANCACACSIRTEAQNTTAHPPTKSCASAIRLNLFLPQRHTLGAKHSVLRNRRNSFCLPRRVQQFFLRNEILLARNVTRQQLGTSQRRDPRDLITHHVLSRTQIRLFCVFVPASGYLLKNTPHSRPRIGRPRPSSITCSQIALLFAALIQSF